MSEILNEINKYSKSISTDSYSMSVGELLSMYREGELILRPEFQRFFRWSVEQKSRLIESLLLGIPIPSIFVSQREDGKWEVIDGLQRLSTLFETAGELRNERGEVLPHLVLSRTKYLTNLENLCWKSEKQEEELPMEAKLRIKRSRIDVNIVLSSSDISAKYELFQRLNTGGSQATDQEVRNAILVMMNPDFFEWISSLGNYPAFRDCIPLTDKALEEQFDLELVTRFIVFRSLETKRLKQIGELGIFLTDEITKMAENPKFDRREVERSFFRTFDWLNDSLGEGSFKKYNEQRKGPAGAMLISIFEVIALGIGYYAADDSYELDKVKLISLHKTLPSELTFTTPAGSGIRASTRIPKTVELGRKSFQP